MWAGGGRWPPPHPPLLPAEAIQRRCPFTAHGPITRLRTRDGHKKNHPRGRLRRRRVVARSQSPSSRACCDEPRERGGLVSSRAQTRSRRRPSSKQVGRVVERANKNPRKTSNHNKKAQNVAPIAFTAPPSFCFACTFILATIPPMCVETAFIRPSGTKITSTVYGT